MFIVLKTDFCYVSYWHGIVNLLFRFLLGVYCFAGNIDLFKSVVKTVQHWVQYWYIYGHKNKILDVSPLWPTHRNSHDLKYIFLQFWQFFSWFQGRHGTNCKNNKQQSLFYLPTQHFYPGSWRWNMHYFMLCPVSVYVLFSCQNISYILMFYKQNCTLFTKRFYLFFILCAFLTKFLAKLWFNVCVLIFCSRFFVFRYNFIF